MKLLTVEEVANFFRISKSTVYAFAERGKIPFYKIGNRLRFAEKDVVDFLGSTRIEHQSLMDTATYQSPRDISTKKKQGYMKIEEVAKLFKTTEQRVNQMLASGMIGCTRVGGRRLFYKPDMASFLAEQMKRSENERFYQNKNKAHPGK